MSNHSLLYFYPWVRQGAATNIALIDQVSGPNAEIQPANVQLPISLWLNENQTQAADITQTVNLYGPRDITGIDPRQIIRMEPHPLTANFEPNYLPAIEFDSPDFPWLFSPLSAGENHRLRPWIVLVVVKKQDGVELNRQPEKPLPILNIHAPAKPGDELPDLAESDLWAHAQAVADQAFSVQLQALQQSPERTLSRLLCPRRLLPNTAYIACVVPAFEVGRIAAGLPPQDLASINNEITTLKPAWLSGEQSPDSVTLPVYHHWEFSTCENDDFESLVKKLLPTDNQATELPTEIGQFKLHIGQADEKLPDLPDIQELSLPGLLQPVSDLAVERQPVPSLLADALTNILNLPADALVDSTSDPVVAPPIYGVTYATSGQPQDFRVGQQDGKAWLNELNLDPRHRVIAALGTQYIQREQESLMAAAWEQIEKVQELNRQRRQAQLACVVNLNTKEKTFDHLSVNDLLQFTAPAHKQMLVRSQVSGSSQLSNLSLIAKMQMRSATPANPGLTFAKGLEGSALRRITRPRGAITRRFVQQVAASKASSRLINILATSELTTVSGAERVKIGGKVTQQSFLTAEDIDNKTFNGNDQWPNWLTLSESGSGYWQLEQPFTRTIPSIPPEPTADDIGLEQVGDTYFEVIEDDFQEPEADGGFIDPDSGVPRPRPRTGPLKPKQKKIVISHATVQALKNQWKENWRAQHPPQEIIENPPVPTDDERNRWALFNHLFKAAASKHVAAITPLSVQTHKIEPSDLDLRLYRRGHFYYRLDEDISWSLENNSKLFDKPFRKPVSLSERETLREEWLQTNISIMPTETLQFPDEAEVKTEILGQLADNIKVEDDVSVVAHPVFAYPVYEALLELAPEYILPNIDRVPFNSASLMAANSQFIEAFLVGLNTEMAREFLWREYPTDQRGTCFHHFWDTLNSGLSSETPRDIKDIHLWDGLLGKNNPNPVNAEPVVLLLRGELLQRYPGAIIYAVPAETDGLGLRPSSDQSKFKYPLFRENLPPDVALIGFSLAPGELKNGSGWFFIIKEQPSEPRFGFDKAPDETLEEALTLNDLSWGHVAGKLEDLQALNYIKVAQTPTHATGAFSNSQVEWGKNAAHMARIALQRPFLVAIHANQLLG